MKVSFFRILNEFWTLPFMKNLSFVKGYILTVYGAKKSLHNGIESQKCALFIEEIYSTLKTKSAVINILPILPTYKLQ